jgi:hypothetical protein
MKVALCFAGFMTSLDETKPFWKDLISKYDIDVYASFWDSGIKDLENFKQIYNPKKLEVEDYSAFKNTTQNLAASYIQLPTQPYTLIPELCEIAAEFRQIPMWYKVWRANTLTGNEKYDVVIRARTDVVLDNFELVQNNMLNVPMGTTEVSFWPNSLGINDLFAFGPPDIMNYYSFLYLRIMDYFNRGHYAFPPEHMLAVHLSNTSLPIRYFPSYIKIIRETESISKLTAYNHFITTPYEDVIWSNTMKFEPHPEIIFKKQ